MRVYRDEQPTSHLVVKESGRSHESQIHGRQDSGYSDRYPTLLSKCKHPELNKQATAAVTNTAARESVKMAKYSEGESVRAIQIKVVQNLDIGICQQQTITMDGENCIARSTRKL